MKPEIKITVKTDPQSKRLYKAINSSSFRKTITIKQGLPSGQIGFEGNETDVKVANLNQPNLNIEFDIDSNEIFVDDMTRYRMLEQFNKNSMLVVELKIYKETDLIVSALIFPSCLSTLKENSYVFKYNECFLNYTDEIFNERSNSNGR